MSAILPAARAVLRTAPKQVCLLEILLNQLLKNDIDKYTTGVIYCLCSAVFRYFRIGSQGNPQGTNSSKKGVVEKGQEPWRQGYRGGQD